VVDIGGRSTELILGEGRSAAWWRVVRGGLGQPVDALLRRRPLHRAEAFRAAQVAAGAELEEALHTFAPACGSRRWARRARPARCRSCCRPAGRSDGRITPEGLRWCIERCIEAGSVDRLDLPGLKADRKRRAAGGGLAILYTLATHFGIDALLPAKGALRQGVIIDLHERLQARARPATATCATLGGRRCSALRGRHRAGAPRGAWRWRCTSRPAPTGRRRGAPRAGLGLCAARDGPDGVAPRPPPPQRLPAGACRRAGLLAEPAAPHRRPGAGPARRPAQDRAALAQRDLRLAGAVPAAGRHQVPRAPRHGPTRELRLRADRAAARGCWGRLGRAPRAHATGSCCRKSRWRPGPRARAIRAPPERAFPPGVARPLAWCAG
jgi:hypothetical protein